LIGKGRYNMTNADLVFSRAQIQFIFPLEAPKLLFCQWGAWVDFAGVGSEVSFGQLTCIFF